MLPIPSQPLIQPVDPEGGASVLAHQSNSQAQSASSFGASVASALQNPNQQAAEAAAEQAAAPRPAIKRKEEKPDDQRRHRHHGDPHIDTFLDSGEDPEEREGGMLDARV